MCVFFRFRRPALLVVLAAVAVFLPSCVERAYAAKNVIIMIADGAGYNTWLATSMYQGKVGKQVYDGAGWLKTSVATYPLNRSEAPTKKMKQDEAVIYSEAKAWDKTPVEDELFPFAGYKWLTSTYTDSAAAATAMATGKKTYNNSINWSNEDRPMLGETIPEIAKKRGRSVGVITTVPWSHATPAGFGGAHSIKRDKYVEIANEMLDASYLDVIMGAGHPDFDDDGKPLTRPLKRSDFQYVGGRKTWETLKKESHPAGWTMIETKEEFEKLAAGPGVKKLLGTAQVGQSLQKGRAIGEAPLPGTKPRQLVPFEKPLLTTVPDLATMAKGAINCLSSNPDGFYLMIEGGAVDWANHSKQPERMIEEQMDYLRAVEAVVAWVDKNSNWEDTVLILTADHECGFVWGPDADKMAFPPLVDNGPGKMPGVKHYSDNHSNSLVPLYARGKDAEKFKELVRGRDATAAAFWDVSGEYIGNVDIFTVMNEALKEPVKAAPKAE